jgi:hypothetical protein
MGKLDGRIAVITGGNSGLGLATAERFVAEGAYVFITGRRQDQLDAAVQTIGGNVTGVQGDVSKLDDLDRLFAIVRQEKGRLDVLFANAGLGEFAPLGQITEALLRDVRYLSAIGMHTQGMSVAESERMFREQAFYDPGNARQQAARGTYDPEYLKYTLGKLMIRKLRADWVAQQPGAGTNADPKAYWHAFHDEFMAHTGPIPLIGAQMLGPKARALF